MRGEHPLSVFMQGGFGPWSRGGGFGDGPHGHGPGARGSGARGPGARGPDGWSFGGPGPGHGFGAGRGRGRGARRGRRGDVRAAILALLAEQPRHGYEIIGEISERSRGLWQPSPGSIYPTLQLLDDEDLVQSNAHSGKRLYELTEQGRAEADKMGQTPPWEEIAQEADPNEESLRDATRSLMAATFQVTKAGTARQQTRAVDVLNEARRALYAMLGESGPPDDEEQAAP